MSKPVIILFNGFGTSKIYWKYAFENKPNLRKLNFLDQLKKIGIVYTFNQHFFNINYYSTPTNKSDRLMWKHIYEKYKPHSSNIDFNLDNLDYATICDQTYHAVKSKYGNDKKYIVIGHSYGGSIAILFSQLYKNECMLCCCIDNPPHILSFYNKYNDVENISILKKYNNNGDLKESLKIIKSVKNVKTVNKEIGYMYKLIGYNSAHDRIKYYKKKLFVPTIFFRAYYSDPVDYQVDWNKYSNKEKKFYETDKNLVDYVVMKNAEHHIWWNQDFSDIIIRTIKKTLINT